MTKYKKSTITACIGLCMTSASVGAQNNDGAEVAIEEIIVSANKLGKATVLELPSAVKVLTAEELSARGATEFADIMGSLPSVQFQDFGPGDRDYIIRGTNSSGPSTVGVYFDETPITGSNAQDGGGRNIDLKLVDMERVEVLNGPQGTQYGANSMSGLVRFVPVKPSADDLQGFVELDYSNTTDGEGGITVNGALNVPIIEDQLAVRVVGWTVDNGGWIDQLRAAGGPRSDINDEQTDGGRFAIRFTPNDRLSVDASYIHQSLAVGGSSRYTPEGTTSFGNAGSGFPAVVASREYENTDITQSPWDEDLDIFSGTFNYEFDAGTLTATVSQLERDIDFSFDSSPILFFFGVPIAGVTRQPQSREVTFAEIRFASTLDGPVQFLVGASTKDDESEFQSQVVTIDGQGLAEPFIPKLANDALGNADGTTFFGRFVNNDLKQTAYFGEVLIDVNDQVNLTLGARYFDSEQDSVEGTIHDFGSAASTGPFVNSSTDDKWTGKIALSYQVSDDINLYGNIAQGFRVGGLNNSDSLFVNDVPNAYGPDELASYELGMKSVLADGNVNLNVGVFTIDWTDIQLKTVAGSTFPFITNAGEAQIDGVEVDLRASLSDNWDVQVGGSYTKAELTKDQPAVDAGEDRGLSGNRIPNVPEFQGFASLSYKAELAIGELSVRGDLNYRGSSDIRFDTSSANNFELGAYTLVNLRASLMMENDWTVSLYAKNITDENAEFDAISSTQDPLAVVSARPRTFGINVRKGF